MKIKSIANNYAFLYKKRDLWYNKYMVICMKYLVKTFKRYKYLVLINLIVIILTLVFPIKYSESQFISGTSRTGIILEPNVIVSQKFISKLNKIEKISILASTINKNVNCNLDLKLYDENKKHIGSKQIKNTSLKDTKKDTNISTDIVDYYLEKPINNTLEKSFYVELSTNCDSIIRLQYYDASENEERAIYNNQATYKKLPIRYSNSSKLHYEFLYPVVVVIISLFIVLGGKNEKK